MHETSQPEATSPAHPRRTPMITDDRLAPPFMAAERASLESWLEFYRATLPIKIGGLTAEQLCRSASAPSNLTLIGLVRHLTNVERSWCTRVVRGQDVALVGGGNDHEAAFTAIDVKTAFDDLDRYFSELATARSHTAQITDLDAPLPGLRHGSEVNLRWVYIHLIEEYARHLGHADLIREAIDAVTGY